MATIDNKTVESINNELIQQMQSEPVKMEVEWPIDETDQLDKHKKEESKKKSSQISIGKTVLSSSESVSRGVSYGEELSVRDTILWGASAFALGFVSSILGRIMDKKHSYFHNLSFKDVNEIYGQAIKEDTVNASKENKSLRYG